MKALVAVEHATLIAIWNMLTTGEFYADPGGDFYTRLNPDKAKNRSIDQPRRMGFDVTLNPRPAAGERRVFASESELAFVTVHPAPAHP